jgi:hypothetical protein
MYRVTCYGARPERGRRSHRAPRQDWYSPGVVYGQAYWVAVVTWNDADYPALLRGIDDHRLGFSMRGVPGRISARNHRRHSPTELLRYGNSGVLC